MAEDWSIDVRKYRPDADEAAIAGIVKHCGIALRNRDSSLVSFTDPDELLRVRESFCRKKLGLTDPDDVLDAAIAKVGEIMQADTTKNRVTVYYLLAEMFGKLGLFGGAATAAAAVAAPAPDPAPEPVAAAVPLAAAATVAAAAAAPVRAARIPERERRRPDAGIWRTGAIAGIVLVAGIAGAWLLAQLIADRSTNTTPDRTAVAVAAAPAIPTGYGVVAETVEGKPALNVYFATAEREVSPLGSEAAAIVAYLASHPGERLSVSGYVDPRGDPVFNEQLAKDRAVNTANALVAAGVPADRIDLDKPADIVGGDASLAEDRRVTVRIKILGMVQDPASVERTQATP